MSRRPAYLSSLLPLLVLLAAGCDFDIGMPTAPGGGGSWYGDYTPPAPFFGCTDAQSYSIGSTVNGTLTASDCATPQGRRFDRYDFTLTIAASVTIDLVSSFDTYLYLFDADGQVIAQDDDGGVGYNSRLAIYLQAGTYSIGASSYGEGATGRYTLSSR